MTSKLDQKKSYFKKRNPYDSRLYLTDLTYFSQIPLKQGCPWSFPVKFHRHPRYRPSGINKSPRRSCHHVTVNQSLLTSQSLQKGAVFHHGVSTIYSRKLSSLSPHPAAQTADQCLLMLKSKRAALNTVFWTFNKPHFSQIS